MPKTSILPTFDPEAYTKITLNDLVIYAVNSLYQQGAEISSEDIVSACFLLFPQRFGLQKHPHWPDSAIVNRHRSGCKGKGYLRGSARAGFQLTARGIKRAQKVEKLLGRPLPAPKTKKRVVPASSTLKQTTRPELKTYARKYVRSIETSDAYKHYKKGAPLNEFDFRSLLLCTMESPPATLARNLEQFKEYVNIQNRNDLHSFLEFCEEKFSYLLDRATKPVGKKSSKLRK